MLFIWRGSEKDIPYIGFNNRSAWDNIKLIFTERNYVFVIYIKYMRKRDIV